MNQATQKLTENEIYDLFKAGYRDGYLLANPSIDPFDDSIESITPWDHRIPDVLQWYGYRTYLTREQLNDFLMLILNKGVGSIITKQAIREYEYLKEKERKEKEDIKSIFDYEPSTQDWERLKAWALYWFPKITDDEIVKMIKFFWEEIERVFPDISL